MMTKLLTFSEVKEVKNQRNYSRFIEPLKRFFDLGVVPEKKNGTFVVIDQNGWEGYCPGPQCKIQNIVVTVKRVGRSNDLNVHDQKSLLNAVFND